MRNKSNMKHKKKKSKSKKELGLSDNSKILKKEKSKHKIKHSSSKEKKDASTKKKHKFDLNSSNSSLIPDFSNDITKLATSTPRLTQQHKNIAPDIGISETSKGVRSQQRTKLDEIRCGLESRLDKSTSDVLMAQVSALLSMTPQSHMSHKKKKSKKLKKHKKGKHDSKDKHKKSKKKGDSHKKRKHKETTLSSEGILKEPLTNLPPLTVQGMLGRSPGEAVTTTPCEIKVKGNVGTSRKSSSTQINQLINSLPARALTSQRTDIVNNQQGKSDKANSMAVINQQLVNKPSATQKELSKVVGQQKTRNLSCSFDDESELDIIPPKNFKKIIKDIDKTTLPNNSVVRKGIEDGENHITSLPGVNIELRHSEGIDISGKDAGLVTSIMPVQNNNKEMLKDIENDSDSTLHHETSSDAGVITVEQELKQMADGKMKERKKKHKKLKKKSKKTKSDGKHKKSKHKKSIKKNHNEKKSELKKVGNRVLQSDYFNEMQHMNAIDINFDLHLTKSTSSRKSNEGKHGDNGDNRNNLRERLATADGSVSETISTGKDLYEMKNERDSNENKTSKRTVNGTNEGFYGARYSDEFTANQPKNDLKRKNKHKRKRKKSNENIASNDKIDFEFINYSDLMMKKVPYQGNLSIADQDSNSHKETELTKSTKEKKKDLVYEENICDPLSQNLYVNFTKAVDETLLSEECNISDAHHKKKKKKDKKKSQNVDAHITEVPKIDSNINECYLSPVEVMDEESVGKKHKGKKHKKRHSGEGNLEQLEELKSSTSVEVSQESEKKRKADDATDITEIQSVKRKKTKNSGKEITNIVSDNKTGCEPQIITVSKSCHGTETIQCDVGGISTDGNEEASKKLMLLQNKKKKSKKDLFENPAEENFGDQLTFEDEAPEKMSCDVEEEVPCVSKKKKRKHKRSNEHIHEKKDIMKKECSSNIRDNLVTGSDEASENKSLDISEEVPSVNKRKKKHKNSSEFIHSKKDEMKTESNNTLKDQIVTCGEQDVSSDRNCEITKENKSKKEKKLKRSMENNQEQESNLSTGISEIIEDHQPTFEGEVSADKSCEQTKPKAIASMSRKKKKHKQSIEMSQPDNIEDKTGFYGTQEHLVIHEGEDLLENKDSEVTVDESSSKKRKHKKHKKVIEMNTVDENKEETDSHDIADKHLDSFTEKKVIEDKEGELAEEEIKKKKKKKKKHKQSIDKSQEDGDKLNLERHSNNEEHLVSFRGEDLLEDNRGELADEEDNRGELADEEIALLRKTKKKKHKRSIDENQEGENEIKIESHNNDEKHLVNFREGELLDDKEKEICILKKRKKKKHKHKQSSDEQPHLSAGEPQTLPEGMCGEIVDEGTDVSPNKNISNNKETHENVMIDKTAQNNEDKMDNKKRKSKRSKELDIESVMDGKTSSSDSRAENEQIHNDYENEVLQKVPSNYKETHKEKHKENWKELTESEHDYKEKKMLISKDSSDKIICENTEEIVEDNISVGSKGELVIDETLSSGENDITTEGIKSDKIDSDETCIDGEVLNKTAEAGNITNVSHQSDNAEVWEDSVGDEQTIDNNIVVIELGNSSQVAPKLLTDNDEGFLQKWKFTSRGFPKDAKAWRNLTAPLPHTWKYECHMNDEENLQENMIKSFYSHYWRNNPELLNKKHKKSLESSLIDDTIMSDLSTESEDSDESSNNEK